MCKKRFSEEGPHPEGGLPASGQTPVWSGFFLPPCFPYCFCGPSHGGRGLPHSVRPWAHTNSRVKVPIRE